MDFIIQFVYVEIIKLFVVLSCGNFGGEKPVVVENFQIRKRIYLFIFENKSLCVKNMNCGDDLRV